MTGAAKRAGRFVAGLAVAAFVVALTVTETQWTIHVLTTAGRGIGHALSTGWHWLTGAAHDTAHDTH